jgi:hypothetical protein
MRCQSVSTTNTDSYRAGCEIAEALVGFTPEVILLFSSTSYVAGYSDLIDGIQDTLQVEGLIVFGGTGDGIYETERMTLHGIAALAMSSDGEVTWAMAVEHGVCQDSFGAAERCAQRALDQLGQKPDFTFVLADGLQADGTLVTAGVASVLPTPFFGGLAGDDRKFMHSCIFWDKNACEDMVGILLGAGKISLAMNAASGWTPVGDPGRINACDQNIVHTVDGKSAREFMREQLGKAPGETDLGVVPLATYTPADYPNFFLRSPSHFDEKTGSVTLFGSILEGQQVRVCTATRQDVLLGVQEALEALQDIGLEPAGAIVISCAGRKWLLEDRCPEEVSRVFEALGKKIPLIGFPSFGEISPFRNPNGSYSPVYFHNVTYVICLIGK